MHLQKTITVELDGLKSAGSNEYYHDLENAVMTHEFRILMSQRNPMIQRIFNQTINLKVLDLTGNRSVTDDDMSVVLKCVKLKVLLFAACPLVTVKTLSALSLKKNFQILAFTLKTPFDVLVEMLRNNPNATLYVPDYVKVVVNDRLVEYPGVKIENWYPNYQIEQINQLQRISPADLNRLVGLPCVALNAANCCMFTLLILDNKPIQFKILLEAYGGDIMKYVLHAFELGGSKLFGNFSYFLRIIFEYSKKIAKEYNTSKHLVLKGVLDLHREFLVDRDTLLETNCGKIERMDLSHLFLNDRTLAGLMSEFEVDLIEDGRVNSVFVACLKYRKLEELHHIVKTQMKSVNNDEVGLFLSGAYGDIRTEAMLNLIAAIFNQAEFNIRHRNDVGDTFLHMLMYNKDIQSKQLMCKEIGNSYFCMTRKYTTKIINQLRRESRTENNKGFTPLQIGLFFDSVFVLNTLKYLKVANFPCDLVTIQCLLRSGKPIGAVLTEHLSSSAKIQRNLSKLEFVELNENERVEDCTVGFILLHHPNVLPDYLSKQNVDQITIRKGNQQFSYRLWEYAILYNFPEETVKLLAGTSLGISNITDAERMNDVPCFKSLKINIIEAPAFYLLLQHPLLLKSYLEKYSQTESTLSHSKISIQRRGMVFKHTMIDFTMKYRFPLNLISMLIGFESKVSNNVFESWLETYFNMFLKPIYGVDSFADIDVEMLGYRYTPDVQPKVDEKSVDDVKMFVGTLDCFDVGLLCQRIDETPIVFFLIHLYCLFPQTKPLLVKVLANCDLNQQDKLGNTIMHILARDSCTKGLYNSCFKNPLVEHNLLNLRNQSAFLIYVKSADLDARAFEFKSISYDSLFQFDNTFNNIFTTTIITDLLNGRRSILTSQIIEMVRYVSSNLKDRFVHGLVHHYPSVVVTSNSLDTKITLCFDQWKSLFERLIELKVPRNSLYQEQTVLDVIYSKRGNDDLVLFLRNIGCKSAKELGDDEDALYFNPEDHVINIQLPSINLVDDSVKFPVHLFVMTINDRANTVVLELFIDERTELRQHDENLMSVLMCSIVGDVLNGVNVENEISAITKRFETQKYIPEDSKQRNAAFHLLKNIKSFERNNIDKYSIELTPDTVLMVIKGWVKWCGLKLCEVDGNDFTIMDVWLNVIKDRNIPDYFAGILLNGFKTLGGKKSEELFGERSEEEEFIPYRTVKQQSDGKKRKFDSDSDDTLKCHDKECAKSFLDGLTNQSDSELSSYSELCGKTLKKPKRKKRSGGDTLVDLLFASDSEKDFLKIDDACLIESQKPEMMKLDKMMKSDTSESEITNTEDRSPNHKFRDESTLELFKAAKNGHSSRCSTLCRKGANVLDVNENNQYPLHLWCISINCIDFKSVAMDAFKSLISIGHEEKILNHVDIHGDTPYSIALTHDVWVWSVKNSVYRKANNQAIERIHIQPGNISSLMTKYGASLRNVSTPDGLSPWHVFASRVYSKNKVKGFGVKCNMFLVLAVLILKVFQQRGNLDVNRKDVYGRSGLDILVQRQRLNELEISDHDFDVLLNEFIS